MQLSTRAIGLLSCYLLPVLSGSGAPLPHPQDLQVFFIEDITGPHFSFRHDGMAVQFRRGCIVYHLAGDTHSQLTLRFLGGKTVTPEGLNKLIGTVNLISGSDSRRWVTDRPTFSELIYREIWPGIDAVYSIQSGNVKSEFRIAAKADSKMVRWEVQGADSVRISSSGALILAVGNQILREEPPQVYEQDRLTGTRQKIDGSFRMFSGRCVGINVGKHDPRNAVVFDPVVAYSTYLGGSLQTVTTSMAVDSKGSAIIAGYTLSSDIGVGITFGSGTGVSAFVAKISPSGDQLLFCTYIGGALDDRAFGVSVDRWDNIYLTGSTASPDFPTFKPLQPSLSGSQDAFLMELDSNGRSLTFSTYWGGSGTEQGNAVAVSRQGLIYLTGDTQSADLPTKNALQPSSGGGQDAFLAVFGISGSALISSSYLGGSGNDHAGAIAIDGNTAVVVGSTDSQDYPVVNPLQAHNAGGQDAFVSQVSGSGKALLFSTYIGGSGGTAGLPEAANAVAIDGAGAIYVVGTTSSPNFPVSGGSLQTNLNGLLDAFVLKLSRGSLVYSTLLGGSSLDYGLAVSVDCAGNAHVAGYTSSSDFPVIRALQSTIGGSYDAFVSEMNPTGTKLLTSTFMGGSASDSAAAIAVDRYGTVFLAGQTLSSNFLRVSPIQATPQAQVGSFVSRVVAGWTPVYYTAFATGGADTLLNYNGSSGANFTFGPPGAIPIAGDWTGTGHQYLGVFLNGTWYLDIDGDGAFTVADRKFTFGTAGDIPIVGDWTGSGTVKAGLYRDGTFILDLSGHLSGVPTGVPDLTFPFGIASDTPVAGDWNSSGKTKVGVFRNGEWLFDTNGSHTINGPTRFFGVAGDRPLLGDWDGSGSLKCGVYRGGSFLLDYNGDWLLDLSNGDTAITFGPASEYGLMFY